MDGSKPRKSDAAATRKRRSSILKSQRCVRAPLSELEFHVATPDQAKSRRVSFSRRTGVAEFEINEATTAWKNVYEEHNKSLESSANESAFKAAPRRVAHLGARATQFEDAEADDIDSSEPSARPRPLPADTDTIQLFRLDANPALRELTDNLNVDFSAMAPLALQDDLDVLRQDLARESKRDNISEISIDVDFNATHFSLKADDDDMSITDTIRGPAVAATEKSQLDFSVAATKQSQVDDWTADKENIVMNPYIAPPPAEFACDDEDILVFDGKKCKFQSKLDFNDEPILPDTSERVVLPALDTSSKQKSVFLDDMTETQAIPVQIHQNNSRVAEPRRRTIVFGSDGDITVSQAVGTNIIEPKGSDGLIKQEDKENQKTMYFNDMADMSVTQALPADIIEKEPQRRKTIVYGEDEGHISMTEAVPAGALLPAPRESILGASKLDNTRRRTIVFENADVSMTGVVGNIREAKLGKINADHRTIVYGNEDGNVSMTGVVSANIIDEENITQTGADRRRTIVYGNDDGNVSMTGVLPAKIIDERKVTAQPSTDRRRTIVYDNDDGNVSMTGVIPAKIIDKTIDIQQPKTDRRQTIVYGNDDGNVSMTGVVPANIIDEAKAKPGIDRRKTIVYENDDGNLSMTGVAPINILDVPKAFQEANTDRRKTMVYGDGEGNVSLTGVLPANIIDEAKATQQPTGQRESIVYGNDCDISVTGVVPVNILDQNGSTVSQLPNIDRRKTVVYGNDDGNISMTGAVPADILDQNEANVLHPINVEREKTINENDDGNLSLTAAASEVFEEANDQMIEQNEANEEPSKEITNAVVSENIERNVSMAGFLPPNIHDNANTTQPQNLERRKTIVYGKDDGNISMTGVLPANILDREANLSQLLNGERRKTIAYGNENLSEGLPSNILNQDDTKITQSLERRKTIVYGNEDGHVSMTEVLPANIINEANDKEEYRRRTIVYGNDNADVSMTGVIPANILDKKHDGANNTESDTDRRKTVVYGNDEGNVSITGIVPTNILGQEANERRKTVVYEDNDLSMTGLVPAQIMAEDANVIVPETPTSILCENTEQTEQKGAEFNSEDNEVEMLDAVSKPQLIESDEDADVSMSLEPVNGRQSAATNLCSTTFNKSLAGQLCSTTLDKSLAEPVCSTTFNKSLAEPVCSTTFNKSLAEPVCSTTFNKSLAEQVGSTTLNKSLADQVCPTTFDKSSVKQEGSPTVNKSLSNQVHSTTFNKSLAGQVCPTTFDESSVKQEGSPTVNKSLSNQVHSTTFNKSLAGQVCPTTFDESSVKQEGSPTVNKSLSNQVHSTTFNKSLAGQVCPTTLDKSTTGQACSTTMNKSLTSQVLVYGATTERQTVGGKINSYIVENVNPEDNQSQNSPDNASLVLSSSSADHSLHDRPPVESEGPPPPVNRTSVLDALLDMSQASVEEIPNEHQHVSDTTLTKPASDTTVTNSVPTSESYIFVKDSDEEPINKDSEVSALEGSEPLAIEYKKPKHGIVCKLQRKLHELKDMLHVKERSPKKEPKAITYTDDNNEEDQKKNADTSKATHDISLEKNQLPKSALRSSSPDKSDVQEKNKTVRIDLTSRMSIDGTDDNDAPEQEHQSLQVDSTSKMEENDQPQNTTQMETTKCQADDTRAILDALSDFTDTRRSSDFEPVPSPEKTRRSSAPDRKSMLISREDLLREISMAQALMKTEMQQTEIELEATEGSSDEQEPVPPRLSGEVVKTLRFEDDESILESNILQKPSSAQPSPRRTPTVIPTYEISDPVKELMNDLIKPMADVEQPIYSRPSSPSRSAQADTLDSSQIDLIPSRPVLIEPRPCLRRTDREVAHSEMHVDPSPRKPVEHAPVIVFDHLNPLNNILLPPVDQGVVHAYNPRKSEQSLSPALDSRCVQTDGPEPRDVEVGMVLVTKTVDRGVASERHVRDSEVNTSIVMKANRELLAASSSLTLVDDALASAIRSRSPVHVIFKLDEPYSSVQLDSELTSDGDSDQRRQKRPRTVGRGTEVTPKPAIKVQRVSTSPRVSRRLRSVSPPDKESSVSSTCGSSVTVAQLYACARSDTSATSRSSRVSDWRPELVHEASSKNLASEQEAGANVVAKIDVLPFMGTSECEWESRAGDTWSFRLLRARLRLVVRLQHRATNTTRALVRADTPVRLALVQHAIQERDHNDPIASLCLCLAAEALQRVCARGVPRAGAVPMLLRRCAAVARVALRWGRVVRAARAALAFSLADDGELSLKVANIPLRSVWEVTLRIELCDNGRGTPYPRAADVRVKRVVASWAPTPGDIEKQLETVPEDWGHVPRTIWKVFKYLKNKTPEDDLLAA